MRFLVGAVLVFSSVAKFLSLGRPASGATFLSAPPLQVAAIEVELLLAVWLLSGRAQRAAWAATLGLFALFTCLSGYMALTGQRHCGCLGAVPATSLQLFMFDATVLVALGVARPSRLLGAAAGEMKVVLRFGALALVVTALAGGLFYSLVGDVNGALAALRGEPIVVSPALSDLGEGRPGEERTFDVQLTNFTDHPIRVVGGRGG